MLVCWAYDRSILVELLFLLRVSRTGSTHTRFFDLAMVSAEATTPDWVLSPTSVQLFRLLVCHSLSSTSLEYSFPVIRSLFGCFAGPVRHHSNAVGRRLLGIVYSGMVVYLRFGARDAQPDRSKAAKLCCSFWCVDVAGLSMSESEIEVRSSSMPLYFCICCITYP